MVKPDKLNLSRAKMLALLIFLVLLPSQTEALWCKVDSKKVIGKNVHPFLEETYKDYMTRFHKIHIRIKCHFAIYLSNLQTIVGNDFQATGLPVIESKRFDDKLIR